MRHLRGRMSAIAIVLGSLLFAAGNGWAQNDPKSRAKIVRELGKGGSESIARIEPYLTDPDFGVRLEAVKAIVEIGTQRSLDPLIKASKENDAEIQIRATDEFLCTGLRQNRPYRHNATRG